MKIFIYKISLLCLILKINLAIAQDGPISNGNFNSAAERNSQVKLPKSPEAAAFEKYGNTPVNLYTGTPDISIPIHTFKGREIDLPMTLTYDASGIKVNQIATNVGLGWNLTMGGRISRISNGVPDDLPQGPYNFSAEIENARDNCTTPQDEWKLNECLMNFMTPVVDGAIDTQLDFYSLNVIGINDYIVRDLGTNDYHTLINPRINVSHLSEYNWLVIGEDGTEYYFYGTRETTEVNGGDDVPGGGFIYSGTSASSWLLTKIISKNKLDIYEFDYKLYVWANANGMPINSMSFTESLTCPIRLQAGATWDMNRNYKTNQQMPFTIKLNGEFVVKFNYKPRLDLNFTPNSHQGGNALDEIVFFDYKTSLTNPTYFKKIIFNHTYFGSPSSTSYTQRRLKLDSLTFYQSNLTDGKTYSFEYDRPESVPNLNSFGQDLVGLNNGAINQNLVPGIIYNGMPTPGGANRNTNFYTMTIGTLTKITYPTKGYTTFSYEQNKIAENTYNPGYTYQGQVYFTMSAINSDFQCEDIDLNFENFEVSPSMTFISPSNFANNCYQYSNPKYISTSRTSLLRLNSSTNILLETEGEGVYLIQKVTGCDLNNDINSNCFSNNIITSYNPCLRQTNTIFYNGITSSHPADFITGGLTFCANSVTPLALEAGNYQITLWSFHDADFNYSSTNSIKIYKMATISIPESWTYNTREIEGFRVKEITDYSSLNVLSTKKEYRYTQDLDINNCSGKQLGFTPQSKVYTTENAACVNGQGGCRTMPTFVITSAGINTTPNMAYESVFEIIKNGNETNGYTQSKFKVGENGLLYPDGLTGVSLTSFEPFFEHGKIIEKNIFDKSKNIRSSESYSYAELEFFRSSSFSYAKNPLNTYARAGQNGNFALNFELGYCTGTEGTPGPAGPPPGWFQGDGWYSGELGKYSYHLVGQNIIGKYGYLSSKQSITYPESGGEIVQTENYSYDAAEPIRLISKDITVSNNVLKTEEYIYHPEYPNNPEKITDILSYSNGELLSAKNNIYTDYGTANLINEIKVAKGNNPLESRIIYDFDPITKNVINSYIPIGTAPTNDSYDSYIFGYNNMYPVAKLSGVKYSQITIARINAIKAKTDVVCSTANENALIAELNLLRTDFPNAQITTYTYNPVYGVTTETDAKGDIKYFTYDELGRLLRIKDRNGNILSENQYHYKY